MAVMLAQLWSRQIVGVAAGAAAVGIVTVADGGDKPIVVGTAVNGVVAGSAVEHVIAGAAVEPVVASATVERIDAGVAVERVVAARR